MNRIRTAVIVVFALLALDPAAASQRRALLIGINDYQANDIDQRSSSPDTWIPEDLSGAVNDIALMRRVLVSRYGFQDAEITTLENQQATRDAMLNTLQQFVSASGPEDIVYIHFSGHGSQVEDLDGDEADGLDETILPADARTPGVPDISDDELGRILAGLTSPNSLVVLDSCHSGTATRGASQLKARSVHKDERKELYRAAGPGSDAPAGYVLMTGAADYQSALDGPIDDGRYYGLFTLAFGRSLGRMPEGSTVKDIYAETRREMRRIGAQFGLFAIPEAQLETDDNRLGAGVLGEASVTLTRRDASRLPWVRVSRSGEHEVVLHGAAELAALPGTVWAIYPPGESAFPSGSFVATATVARLDNGDAVAATNRPAAAIEANSRAVFLQPASGATTVPLRLDRMSPETREHLQASLREAPGAGAMELVGKGDFARFIVDEINGEFVVYGAGGIQEVARYSAANLSDAAASISRLAQRSRHVFELQSLDNPTSAMTLDVSVNPRDSSGGVRGVAVVGAARTSAFRVRGKDEPRDSSNSLVLELRASEPAYITVVDVDPDGHIAILFPNEISQRNGFYTDGLIPGSRSVRIPDGLENNAAGFNWDLVPPQGVDTIRVFAARQLETAETLRAYVRQLGAQINQRGGAGGYVQKADLYTPKTASGYTMDTRGVATVSSAGQSNRGGPDWVAASVSIVIEQ